MKASEGFEEGDGEGGVQVELAMALELRMGLRLDEDVEIPSVGVGVLVCHALKDEAKVLGGASGNVDGDGFLSADDTLTVTMGTGSVVEELLAGTDVADVGLRHHHGSHPHLALDEATTAAVGTHLDAGRAAFGAHALALAAHFAPGEGELQSGPCVDVG